MCRFNFVLYNSYIQTDENGNKEVDSMILDINLIITVHI